jgi:hypothetical protein
MCAKLGPSHRIRGSGNVNVMIKRSSVTLVPCMFNSDFGSVKSVL